MIERRVMAMERMAAGSMRSVSVNGMERLGGANARMMGIAPVGVSGRASGFGAQVRPAVAECEDERSQAATWFWTATLAVIVWSVSYLLRQPGVAGSALDEPFSFFGNFALEGMVLALAWLGVLVTACLAVLTGAARIEDPSA